MSEMMRARTSILPSRLGFASTLTCDLSVTRRLRSSVRISDPLIRLAAGRGLQHYPIDDLLGESFNLTALNARGDLRQHLRHLPDHRAVHPVTRLTRKLD